MKRLIPLLLPAVVRGAVLLAFIPLISSVVTQFNPPLGETPPLPPPPQTLDLSPVTAPPVPPVPPVPQRIEDMIRLFEQGETQ
jgi:hypothetical protein